MSHIWKVGDRAKWLGASFGKPQNATWNPPPPGWVPPTREQRERNKLLARNLHVEVVAIADDGKPSLVRADDGFELDPRMHIGAFVQASYEGWLRPCRCRVPVGEGDRCRRCTGSRQEEAR